MTLAPHLRALESEAIHVFRDGFAEAERPVILFSAGKDSTVLAHIARKAFYPARPPLPLLHVDSTWEFRELIEFRNAFADSYGFELTVYSNEEGRALGVNPIDHADVYTNLMRTEALKQALDRGRYDVVFGGARRDEEASRAKERIVSVRGAGHAWDPRNQRPELWRLYNWQMRQGQSLRVFPLSNWTELDLWNYIDAENIQLAPLYYAKERQIVEKDGILIAIDDEQRWLWGGAIGIARIRFRTLGCWPVTGGVHSTATGTDEIISEINNSRNTERNGRVGIGASLEKQKREGYF